MPKMKDLEFYNGPYINEDEDTEDAEETEEQNKTGTAYEKAVLFEKERNNMFLVLGEKPSVAQALAEVLEGKEKRGRLSGRRGLCCKLVSGTFGRVCSPGSI